MKKYYTNAPCNVAREEAKPRSLLALISAGAVIFTLLRMSFLLFPIENNGFEEIAVMAFAPSASEISADDGKLPTETAIEVSEIPTRKVIPLKGAVTSGYNKREDPFGTGKTELHRGIDISAAYDTKIVSYADGTVKKVSSSPSYGNYIIISHTDTSGKNYETLYAHCEKILAKQNTSVLAGEEIAVAGSTGRSTGPHLHFEVRVDGNIVDPTPWLAQAQ